MADPRDEVRQGLLQEGAKSYRDAVTAILEYRREVQKICHDVMTKRLGGFASALKIDGLSPSAIESLDWPGFKKWDGVEWCLGVRIVREDLPGLKWWAAYCCLAFQPEHGLYCWFGEWFSRAMIGNVVDALKHHDPSLKTNGEHVWLQDNLSEAEGASFDQKLDGLYTRWVDLREKAGGLAAVLT